MKSQFIERLRIPFGMVSGGSQLGLDGSHDSLKPIEDTVKRFARAILDKSSALSVRGEKTANYLRSLDLATCFWWAVPSMTMNGRGHAVHKNATELNADSRMAFNIETSIDLLGDVIERNSAAYDMTYFPQDIKTMELMLWGVEKYAAVRDSHIPLAFPSRVRDSACRPLGMSE